MLLRLAVRGFKNLGDVEVRFGPLTCFLGRNGVGKSNILDAIQFLGLLSRHEIQRAAALVRRPTAGQLSPLDLFYQRDPTGTIEITADLVVPREIVDDLGQRGETTATLLKYQLVLGYAAEPAPHIELRCETLDHVRKGDARGLLGFGHKRAFSDSIAENTRRGGAFISTETVAGVAVTKLHGDGGSRGRPVDPGRSPRTVLGGTNTADYPTVLAAQREMASWLFLHLEPSAMRSPDSIGADPFVGERGSGIAATLHRLGREAAARKEDPAAVSREIVNDLKALDPDIHDLRVDRDEARDQLVLQVQMRGSTEWYGPRSLSDGTLRFLALVAMQADRSARRMVCLEEPENGIHPSRIPALMRVLGDYAVDPTLAVDQDNPLRQVVVNTHSPVVIAQLAEHEALFVEEVHHLGGRSAVVRPICGTWRGDKGAVPREHVLATMGGAPLPIASLGRQLGMRYPGLDR